MITITDSQKEVLEDVIYLIAKTFSDFPGRFQALSYFDEDKDTGKIYYQHGLIEFLINSIGFIDINLPLMDFNQIEDEDYYDKTILQIKKVIMQWIEDVDNTLGTNYKKIVGD